MRARDITDLLLLAALWGASFLFIRLGAVEFGPVTLAALRCLGATLFLLPILSWRGQVGALRTHWRAVAWVGVVNSALPFSLYGVALLAINTGLSAIFNAATPLWAAAIGALWLHERLGASRVLGLFIGLAGVMISARLGSAQPATGMGYELQAIAAVVIGGTSLSGGKGSIVGTVIGALIISVLNNGLQITSVPQEWQNVILGCVIVVAVYADQARKHTA